MIATLHENLVHTLVSLYLIQYSQKCWPSSNLVYRQKLPFLKVDRLKFVQCNFKCINIFDDFNFGGAKTNHQTTNKL